MNDKKKLLVPTLLESLHGAESPIRVPRDSFRMFSRCIRAQLRDLEAQWEHTASPAARKAARRMERSRPRKPR